MISFIITGVTLLILIFIKSKHNFITLIHFTCLTICNTLFLQNNDLFSKAFSTATPGICLICSMWNMQKDIYKPRIFHISLILFAICAIKAFCATNSLSMFIYMETSMILIILMMFSENKHINVNTIYQYITYTFISACLLLIAIIQIEIDTKEYGFIPTTQLCYWLIALATIIKLPMFPFHYWVPIVHGKSATTCSVLLAGIILKYSSLIIIRFLMPLHPYTTYLIVASIISAVSSQCCKKNIKVIFAYSSIVHMNLYLFIPLANTNNNEFVFSLLAHSVTMALVFLIADIIKTRYKTLYIDRLTNISNKIWILLLTASLCVTSIPGNIGFVAELQALCNANNYNSTITAIIMAIILLSSCYIMYTCFVIKDNTYKYDFFKFNNWQKITIITTTLLVVTGGTLPLLHALRY